MPLKTIPNNREKFEKEVKESLDRYGKRLASRKQPEVRTKTPEAAQPPEPNVKIETPFSQQQEAQTHEVIDDHFSDKPISPVAEKIASKIAKKF